MVKSNVYEFQFDYDENGNDELHGPGECCENIPSRYELNEIKKEIDSCIEYLDHIKEINKNNGFIYFLKNSNFDNLIYINYTNDTEKFLFNLKRDKDFKFLFCFNASPIELLEIYKHFHNKNENGELYGWFKLTNDDLEYIKQDIDRQTTYIYRELSDLL